jgi:2Fe-2S ferredoxin
MPKIIFIVPDGGSREVDAPIGKSVLDIAQSHDFDVEGACEGSLACSTCHIIVDPEWYHRLRPAEEEETDMLDLAYGLTRTSRLSCQLLMTEELDGLVINLPSETHNLMI